MDTKVATFHGRVYGNKLVRKESDLPEDFTNASAATRRVFEPSAQPSKQPVKDKNKRPKKVVHKRISSSGDELQNQVDSGWVNVNLSLMAVTDLIQLAKKLTKGVNSLHTLKLECFPKEYDRLEADAARQHCKPKYALSSADHETLVKSTLELACNPKLKGRVPSAIKEVLANAAALEELTVGMNLPPAIWKVLGSSLGAHQNLQTLSLAGSGIGDTILQVLGAGLRTSQTIAELNLSGCKISDEGVQVLAGIIKANAAEADVQEWHEGLREYPDLSLAPHLRRQQFRARHHEIRGRVQARCGGLQILHLAENKITDAGADVLLDALAMDRSMVLLDLSANQLTMKSGKRFSKLMRRHKGLLRVDLRSNAGGLSGVLQMMQKGSTEPALSPHLAQGSELMLSDPGPATKVKSEQSEQQLRKQQSVLHQSLDNGDSMQDWQQGLDTKDRSTAQAVKVQTEGSEKVRVGVSSRKGLVPKFTADRHHVGEQSGKENSCFGNAVAPGRQSSSAIGLKLSARPVSGKPRAATKAKHVRRPSTARPAQVEFEFEPVAELCTQPTASMAQFAAAAEAGRPACLQSAHFASSSFSVGCVADSFLPANSLLDNAAVGSASFAGWADPADHQHQHTYRHSVCVDDIPAQEVVEQHSTAGIAHMPSRTTTSQYDQAPPAQQHGMSQQHVAAELAGDEAYLRGMSQAWQDVHEAEEEGRQRAAAVYAVWNQSAAGDRPDCTSDSAPVEPSVQNESLSAPSRVQHHGRPSSAQPVNSQQGLANQRAEGHGSQPARAGPVAAFRQAPVLGHAEDRSCESHSGFDQAGSEYRDVASRAADAAGDVASRMSLQASAAAAAMEAAKLNVWKAEVMSKIEGLRSSLDEQAVERQRAEAKAAQLQLENHDLELAAKAPCSAANPQPPAPLQKATHPGKRRGQTNRRKVRKQKKGRHAEAALTGEGLSEEVLQEQQQVMGDLSQVIQSLNGLVSDIEDAQAHTGAHDSQAYMLAPGVQQLRQDLTQQPHDDISSVLANVTRQLSVKFDLHDKLQ